MLLGENLEDLLHNARMNLSICISWF